MRRRKDASPGGSSGGDALNQLKASEYYAK